MDDKARHKLRVSPTLDVLDDRVLPAVAIVPTDPVAITDVPDATPVPAEVVPAFPSIGGSDGQIKARDGLAPAPTDPAFPSIGGSDGQIKARDALVPSATDPAFPSIGGSDGQIKARDGLAPAPTDPAFPSIGGSDGQIKARMVAPSDDVQPAPADQGDQTALVASTPSQTSAGTTGQSAASTDTETPKATQPEAVTIKRPRKQKAGHKHGKAFHRNFKLTGGGKIHQRPGLQIAKV